MVFSSFLFLFLFLPFTLAAYYLVPERARLALLTFVSYVFYGWWNPAFCLLMLFSTALDFYLGAWLSSAGASRIQRRTALVLSILINLALLGYFKYAAFVAENLNTAAKLFGLEPLLPVIAIALPVGISFYTFQSMSYCIDLYRGEARPARSLMDFACFVSLFPQLVAGPIVRYRELADQLVQREHSTQKFAEGGVRFIIGFSKKILIANPCGQVADAVFSASALSTGTAWVGVLAYAFQIYFDFSGYSDMAIGLGKMFGFRFPENFCSPYRAGTVTDFWRRWHITLSSFLRDYVYIPLGGNRRGSGRTYFNLLFVMFIGGLWHGAQWTFVIWGCVHGAALAIEKVGGLRSKGSGLLGGLQSFGTFLFIVLTWVLFRSENLEVAARVYQALFGLSSDQAISGLLWADITRPWALLMLGAAALLVWVCPRAEEISERPLTVLRVCGFLVLFLIATAMMLTQGENPFLYFQF